MPVAYCTNVHAGDTLEENLAALDRHAVAVRRILGDTDALPLGWWLSARSLGELRGDGAPGLDRLRRFFDGRALEVATLNGFPFGDFHAAVVKHDVYRPDWMDPRRVRYTIELAEVLAALLPRGADASISTLPIGWPSKPDPQADLELAANHLLDVVEALRSLRDRTSTRIHVDLEPEPGCILQRSSDVVAFAERFLWPAAERRLLARDVVADHVGLCHDVCHAAVMHEEQADCLRAYANAGLRVGKVQVSSALEAALTSGATSAGALAALRAFAEDRYLHQTVARMSDRSLRFFDDLPWALAALEAECAGTDDRRADGGRAGEGRDDEDHPFVQRVRPVACRVHFHIPVHIDRIELPTPVGSARIGTTQDQIHECLRAVDGAPTLEVETYAWGVLPPALRPAELAAGIADELRWTRAVVDRVAGGRIDKPPQDRGAPGTRP
ncbi:MAG: metabolite traffic protein EboE [Phycisphaerales bacterium]